MIRAEFAILGAGAIGSILAAHLARGDRSARELVHLAPVVGAESLGEQDVERLADHLLGRVAEDLARAAVEQHDPVPRIDGNDSVLGDVEDFGQPIGRNAHRNQVKLGAGWGSRRLRK